jgi:hypothetical protein
MPRVFFSLVLAATLTGCIQVNIPNEFHGTLDINLKIDRALNDFFGDLDQKSATTVKPATPATP